MAVSAVPAAAVRSPESVSLAGSGYKSVPRGSIPGRPIELDLSRNSITGVSELPDSVSVLRLAVS